MWSNCVNLKGVVAATVLFVAAGTAVAQESEGDLLESLAQATAPEANRIERQLQALWSKSGSASMDLLLKRGRDALMQDDIAAALEHLTALTDHAPNFAEGWHLRASAYFEAGRLGPAMADLERALTLNPQNYNAIYGLGAILELVGDSQRAYDAYLQARSIHPHHEQVTTALERLKPKVEGKAL